MTKRQAKINALRLVAQGATDFSEGQDKKVAKEMQTISGQLRMKANSLEATEHRKREKAEKSKAKRTESTI